MKIFNTYTSGDLVPTSGSYAALHSTPHKLVHREIYVEGNRFEPCKLCPLGVIYRLEQSGLQRPLFVTLSHEMRAA
ncbi:MAG: hypothetical protein ABSF97_00775 [Candidatus Sulfotelmatobacter sp.]|jgi:hypothetical protein